MRVAPLRTPSLQAPALPGFVVYGYPKMRGLRSSPGARAFASLSFERVQTSARGYLPRVSCTQSGTAFKHGIGDLFERVQIAHGSTSAIRSALLNLGPVSAIERVQTNARWLPPTDSITAFNSPLAELFERVQTGRPQPPLLSFHRHTGGTPMRPPK